MSQEPSLNALYAPAWQTLLAVAVLNTVIALSLWLTVPTMGSLGPTWVYSQCVGLSIASLAMLIGRVAARLGLADFARRAPIRYVALMLVPAAPLGYLAGHLAGQAMLGQRVKMLSGSSASAALLATVLATALAGYALWTRQRLVRDAHAREEAQRHAAEAELRLLRAQLEPHMLFNTLANLRELMVADAGAAQQMLDELIVYLRSALAATRNERTTLEAEFAQLAAYLKLMARRMGPRLAWHIELPPELRSLPVPPMLLQPLVENAIRHGLEPQVGVGTIELRAERTAPNGGSGGDAVLCLVVADTGRGLAGPPRAADQRAESREGGDRERGGGYGLVHVRERLRSLYGGAASLVLEPVQPHGVRAVVSLPITAAA
jgi:LytS/YehU family sensor histidine kinase